MREIPLTRGAVTLVDDEDYERLAAHKWHVTNGYASRHVGGRKGRTVYLHRVLMAATQGLVVDHINGDGLDNRRTNLRVCTQSQNLANARVTSTTRRSQYKGVTFDPAIAKWCVGVGPRGTRRYRGSFASEVEAALMYDSVARKLYGEFARLNFPAAGERGALVEHENDKQSA